MTDGYKTLRQAATDEYVVKRSRFIVNAAPVKNESEALAFIAEIKQKYWDATHNVYAYSLRDGFIKRFTDDGEPQGTAGMPVLNVLTSEDITDCAVVVTRYFGGVLLGTGGLVRAYSHSAKLGVDKAGISLLSMCDVLSIKCDYTFFAKTEQLIREFNGIIESSDFGETVSIVFTVESKKTASFCDKLVDITNGKVSATKISERLAEIAGV